MGTARILVKRVEAPGRVGPLGIDRRDAKRCLLGMKLELSGKLYLLAALQIPSLGGPQEVEELSHLDEVAMVIGDERSVLAGKVRDLVRGFDDVS